MLATLLRSQPAWASPVICRSLWYRLAYSSSSRCLASPSAAGGTAADARPAWRQRFHPVAPGSVLKFELQQAAADLTISIGEHEAIELSGSSELGQQLVAEQQAAANPASSDSVTVAVGHCSTAAGGAAARGTRQGQPATLQVHAHAPSRFLTVEATTAGGSVHVDVIQEGSLRLSTGGGSISVPKVKAFDAHLASGGGSITGAVTGVDVQLRSSGGSVQLKSLVGKKAVVDSGGGAITLGACYADHLELQSGGGPVRITNMDCRGGSALLRSSGGPVIVDSLDGNLEVESAGGDVQVQLHDNAGSVSISSGGGGIQLFLNPAVAGTLRLRNCARIAARPGTVKLAQPQEDGCLLLRLPLGAGAAAGHGAAGVGGGGEGADGTTLPPLSRLQRGGSVGHAAPGTQSASADIVLDAGGSGSVSLAERSWMEALRQRWS